MYFQDLLYLCLVKSYFLTVVPSNASYATIFSVFFQNATKALSGFAIFGPFWAKNI